MLYLHLGYWSLFYGVRYWGYKQCKTNSFSCSDNNTRPRILGFGWVEDKLNIFSYIAKLECTFQLDKGVGKLVEKEHVCNVLVIIHCKELKSIWSVWHIVVVVCQICGYNCHTIYAICFLNPPPPQIKLLKTNSRSFGDLLDIYISYI